MAYEILVLDNHKSRYKCMLSYSAFLTSLLSDFIWIFAHIHVILFSKDLHFVSLPLSFLCHLLFAFSTLYVLEVYTSFYFYPNFII